MYNDLIECDPKLKKLLAEKEARGKIRGLQEGFVDIIEARFPDLAEIAKERVTQVTESNMLRLLLRTVATASDAVTVKQVLDILVA